MAFGVERRLGERLLGDTLPVALVLRRELLVLTTIFDQKTKRGA
jgi:hypothetical protein